MTENSFLRAEKILSRKPKSLTSNSFTKIFVAVAYSKLGNTSHVVNAQRGKNILKCQYNLGFSGQEKIGKIFFPWECQSNLWVFIPQGKLERT